MANSPPQILLLLPKYSGVTGKLLPGEGLHFSIILQLWPCDYFLPMECEHKHYITSKTKHLKNQVCILSIFSLSSILWLNEDWVSGWQREQEGAEPQYKRPLNLYRGGHLLTRNTHIGLCDDQEIYFFVRYWFWGLSLSISKIGATRMLF